MSDKKKKKELTEAELAGAAGGVGDQRVTDSDSAQSGEGAGTENYRPNRNVGGHTAEPGEPGASGETGRGSIG